MNAVLSQLPKAQEAYNDTVAAWADVDTTEVLLAMDKAIRETASKGMVGCGVGGITDLRLGEKAATQLTELGYYAVVNATGQAPQLDGSHRTIYSLAVSWRLMPPNSRDAYTV